MFSPVGINPYARPSIPMQGLFNRDREVEDRDREDRDRDREDRDRDREDRREVSEGMARNVLWGEND